MISRQLAMISITAFAAFLAPLHASSAEAKGPEWSAQLRLRTEADRKNATDTSELLVSTHMRSRVGAAFFPAPALEMRLEIQDTRSLGSEPAAADNPASATVGNAKGVDLNQAYASLKLDLYQLTIGRQKVALGSQRFISSLEWHPTARTFDGLTGRWATGASTLMALGLLIRDADIRKTGDRDLLGGLHYSYTAGPALDAEIYGFYDQSMLPFKTFPNYDLVYVGERLRGRVGPAILEEELIFQGGEVGTSTSAAFFLATRVGMKSKAVAANAGLDWMSGDDDATDDVYNSYIANYFFAHAFFGWMDYFASNPNEGVMDWRLDADFTPVPAWKFRGEAHYFTPHKAPAGSDDAFGTEVDLEAHWLPFPKTNITLGAGLFIPGGSATRLPAARGEDQAAYFLYLMPTFGF